MFKTAWRWGRTSVDLTQLWTRASCSEERRQSALCSPNGLNVGTTRGAVHRRRDIANLGAAEIALTDLGRKGGTQILYEHNSRDRIGRCDASWEGSNGELRVSGIITDARVEQSIRNGKTHGLSLGTDVVSDSTGNALYKSQQELSVCTEPRRPGCYIDVVDGKQIRKRRNASRGKPR